jgi:superfamily II DNA or RNA helicase
MTIALRDYQKECLEITVDEFKAGIHRQLIILPTCSKTVILAREELITQTVDIGICMADRDEIFNQKFVGSIQSCSRPKRLKRLREQGFEVLMIDEAHQSARASYKTLIEALGFTKEAGRLLPGSPATAMWSACANLTG